MWAPHPNTLGHGSIHYAGGLPPIHRDTTLRHWGGVLHCRGLHVVQIPFFADGGVVWGDLAEGNDYKKVHFLQQILAKSGVDVAKSGIDVAITAPEVFKV